MGCNGREKTRGGRKSRNSAGRQPSGAPSAGAGRFLSSSSSSSSNVPPGTSTTIYPTPLQFPHPNSDSHNQTPVTDPNYDPIAAAGGWSFCTEDQLEALLLKNLEIVYKNAISRLVSLGYEDALALHAILRNGHCYGTMDVLTNILHNTISYLNSAPSSPDSAAFSDLRHLEEYSLAGMVCLLQQLRPALSRGDAMWCLLMADLHVGQASAIEIPVLPPSNKLMIPNPTATGLHKLRPGDVGRLMKSLSKCNASSSSCRRLPNYPLSIPSSSSAVNCTCTDSSDHTKVVAEVLKRLEGMSIHEDNGCCTAESTEGSGSNEGGPSEEQKKDAIFDLQQKIKELEVQVKERKEWAQERAIQAARRLSNDLTGLRVLRMEREENQRANKGKQTLEDSTMKRLSDMEAALRRASGQVDRANAEVRRLETENAEIRAEMEASKLSAAESVTACLEVTRREKRCLKRLLAWEKNRKKLQEEIADEKRKIAQMQRQLEQVKEAQKQAEVKWKEEVKAKELAITQVAEEKRAKEAAEASIKRKHETLRQKIELDFQRHKDDIERLEDELARIKTLTELNTLIASNTGDPDMTGSMKTHYSKYQESVQKVNPFRKCVVCMREEVSVVFLPCTHQILCANCSDEQERRAIGSCPCCKSRIEQRIHVYGVSC